MLVSGKGGSRTLKAFPSASAQRTTAATVKGFGS